MVQVSGAIGFCGCIGGDYMYTYSLRLRPWENI